MMLAVYLSACFHVYLPPGDQNESMHQCSDQCSLSPVFLIFDDLVDLLGIHHKIIPKEMANIAFCWQSVNRSLLKMHVNGLLSS